MHPEICGSCRISSSSSQVSRGWDWVEAANHYLGETDTLCFIILGLPLKQSLEELAILIQTRRAGKPPLPECANPVWDEDITGWFKKRHQDHRFCLEVDETV
jgi:hypothetical protein